MPSSFPIRKLNLISASSLIMLLILSAIFWRERAWLLDIAFQTNLMIKDGALQVQVYRYGSALVQLLPLAAIKLGLPISWISFLYSISFPLIYLIFWFCITQVFKQHLMGLVLALLYTAMVYDGFYWCTSELQQGLGFLLVVWAMILRHPKLNRTWHWLFLLIALPNLILYHPLCFIPFFFFWVYFGLENKTLRHKGYIFVLLIMILSVWAKGQWASNWYDTAKMTTFNNNFEQYFPNFFTFPAYKKLALNSLYYWWGLPLLAFISSAYLIYLRKFLLLLMVWGALIGFSVLNAIGTPDPSYRFYSEVNYYPLILFVAIPFVYLAVKNWAHKAWVLPLVAAFIFVRLALITWHHQPYTERVNYLTQLSEQAAEQYGGQRFLTAESAVDMDKIIMSWGTPFESMLMTASKAPNAVKTLLINPNPAKFSTEERQDTSLFLMEFNNFSMEKLQERGYYQFEAGSYKEVVFD